MIRRLPVRTSPADERCRGSATLELVILAPVLLALLGLVIVAARIMTAGSAVEQAAAAGARAASLERDARSARAAAVQSVRHSLSDQSITCDPLSYQVDVAGFAVPVGRAAAVTVAVICSVPIGDLAVPGMPGARVVQATAASPLDSYRGRA